MEGIIREDYSSLNTEHVSAIELLLPSMNSSSGKSAAVSSSAAAGKNEVITIDLCLSDTDDEHEPGFKSSSSSVAAAATSALKRTSNPGKPKGKSKRPKPDPAAFANDNYSDVEIIEISDDEDEDGGKQSAAASAYASSTSATNTAGASKSPVRGMQARSVTLSVEGAAMLMASRTMAKEEPTADSRKKVNEDDEVELVEAPSNSGWRQVSAAAAASAGAENTGNASSASTSSRTGQPKDDRAYETNAEGKVDDDDDEEFELVATKGTNALIDFPHSRENCVQFSFANGDKKAHCVSTILFCLLALLDIHIYVVMVRLLVLTAYYMYMNPTKRYESLL